MIYSIVVKNGFIKSWELPHQRRSPNIRACAETFLLSAPPGLLIAQWKAPGKGAGNDAV